MNNDTIVKGTVNVICRKCKSEVMGVFYLSDNKTEIKCLECGHALREEVSNVDERPENWEEIYNNNDD